MFERQKIGRWMPAFAALVLLLFSANAEIGISQTLERPLPAGVKGLGAPAQPNESSDIAAAAGRALWLTQPTKVPGSKKSAAVLNIKSVQTLILFVSRSRQITFTASRDSALVRITPVRAPPESSFAV